MKLLICTFRPLVSRSTLHAAMGNRVWHFRQLSSTSTFPILRQELRDGSEKEISEEDLYRHTRHRFLCDEKKNLEKRYRKFNLSALIDAAVVAAGKEATAGKEVKACIKVLKCLEGQYNKAFILTMDNGFEILAKIPNPNAGPAFYTTASEVATMQFVRTVLKLPVPRVYAYSADAQNPVGAEYILAEKADGTLLRSIWHHMEEDAQKKVIAQLVEFETQLTSVSFTYHGYIFYKRNLEGERGRTCDLYSTALSPGHFPESHLMKEFAVGPSTEAKIWEDERAMMDLDRGPWSNPLSYLAAMAISETQWVELYAQPRHNPYQSSLPQETPEAYMRLLDRFLQLAPYLAPHTTPSQTSLFHPHLDLNNIFVNAKTLQITYIVDWQSARMSEPCFQVQIPRMLVAGSGLIDGNKDTIEQSSSTPETSDQAQDDAKEQTQRLCAYYKHLTKAARGEHYATSYPHNTWLMAKPVSFFPGAWTRREVFSLRHALFYVAARWEEDASISGPCPAQFTADEIELHRHEWEMREDFDILLRRLQSQHSIGPGGMVLQEKFGAAVRDNETIKQMWLHASGNEEQKDLFLRTWPYGGRDWYAKL